MKRNTICLITILFLGCTVCICSVSAQSPIRLSKSGRTSRLRRRANLELKQTAKVVRSALAEEDIEKAKKALNEFENNPYLINWVNQEDFEALKKEIQDREEELEEKKKKEDN